METDGDDKHKGTMPSNEIEEKSTYEINKSKSNEKETNESKDKLDAIEEQSDSTVEEGTIFSPLKVKKEIDSDLACKEDIVKDQEDGSLTKEPPNLENSKVEEEYGKYMKDARETCVVKKELGDKEEDTIREGEAIICKLNKVFYNPVQEFNRDLSVAALSVFADEQLNDPRCKLRGKKRKSEEPNSEDEHVDNIKPRESGVKYDDGIIVLEALSASGLRSIRYAKEVPGIKQVVANDISLAAVESIQKNIEFNNVQDLVSTSHSDASLLMYTKKAQDSLFDAVDLDPYGCPSRFLDAAVQCVRDGGMLLITCTDMAVLAGNTPESCYVKYGAISLRNPACHEMALRICLQCIESHANRYGRYIVPLLSISADFYIRVILKVYTSPAMCKRSTSKLSMIYQCAGCQMFSQWPLGLSEKTDNKIKFNLAKGPPIEQKCAYCSRPYYQGGPIWSAALHDPTFVDKMLIETFNRDFKTQKRMEGMLELVREELSGPILYYTIESLCSKVHCEVVPRLKFVSALLHAGYNVSLSHAIPNSVKTNAPPGVLWDIIRTWVESHPVNPKRLMENSVAEKILSGKSKIQVNFDIHPSAVPQTKKKLLRYQPNPEPNWGPGCRDKTNTLTEEKVNKRHLNQNKKKRRYFDQEETKIKTGMNLKQIDIIEVVTLTDDENEANGKGDIIKAVKTEKNDNNSECTLTATVSDN